MGDWGQLSSGGKDGLFVIVVSLAWWVHAQGSVADDSKVDNAISDVSWVMRHLITSLIADEAARDTPPPDMPTEPQTKHSQPLKTGPRKRVCG